MTPATRDCDCGEEATTHVTASYKTHKGEIVVHLDDDQCDDCAEYSRKQYNEYAYDVVLSPLAVAS